MVQKGEETAVEEEETEERVYETSPRIDVTSTLIHLIHNMCRKNRSTLRVTFHSGKTSYRAL